jgi:hypothetical protein
MEPRRVVAEVDQSELVPTSCWRRDCRSRLVWKTNQDEWSVDAMRPEDDAAVVCVVQKVEPVLPRDK